MIPLMLLSAADDANVGTCNMARKVMLHIITIILT